MIQWEKDQTEEAGLVKIDLLGNRSLAVIRDAIAAVARAKPVRAAASLDPGLGCAAGRLQGLPIGAAVTGGVEAA